MYPVEIGHGLPPALIRAGRAFPPAFVPKLEVFAALNSPLAAQQDPNKPGQDMSAGIHPQFASGSENWLRQNFESSDLLQRNAQEHFLADKQLFIKTADSIEIFSTGEKECAGTEVVRKIDDAK